MADSSRTIMTDAGFALETRVRANETKMQFTRAAISTDGHFSDTDDVLAKLTGLANVQQDGQITAVQVLSETTVHVQIDINQAEAKNDYQMLSAALYAKDDSGTEIMYGVTVLQDPVFVHKDDDGSYLGFGIDTAVGRATNVTVVVDPANMVTQQVFEMAMADHYTKKEADDKFVTNEGLASKLPTDIAHTGAANTFTEVQKFNKGATDGDGNSFATEKDVETKTAGVIRATDNYGARNLILNSGNMENYSGWTIGGAGTSDNTKFHIYVSPHDFYKGGKANLIQINNKNVLSAGYASEVFLLSNSFSVTAGKAISYSFLGFASENVVHEDVYFIGYKADGTQVPILLQKSIKLSYTRLDKRSGTFTVPNGVVTGQVRFDNNGSTDGKDSGFYFTELKVAEESVPSPWMPSPNDSDNWQKTKVTGDDGGNKYSFTTANTTDLVAAIQALPLGYHTFYCQAGVQGNPSSQAVRGIAEITTAGANPLGVGYLTDSTGDFWSFYVDSSGLKLKNKQDKLDYTPANDDNVVHRNPNTGVVSEPVDFTKLTVNGGKSVATSDDLKSLEDASWRELNFDVSQGNYKAFSAAKIVYKINRDEKYISFFFAGTPVGSTSSKSTLVTDTTSLVMDLSSVLTKISNINFQTNYGQISDSDTHAASLGYAGAKVVFTSQVYISKNLAGVTFLPQDYPDCRIYYTSLVNGI